MEVGPSKLALRFLRWFIREDYRDTVEGDLLELYTRRVEKIGSFRANLLFMLNVISFCRPFAWRRLESIHWMLWYRITLFRRSIKQERFVTSAKFLGMGIGLLVFALASFYINEHKKFDLFIDDIDHLYRVNLLATFEEIDGTELGTSHYRLAPLCTEYPEIESYTRVFDSQSGYLSIQGEKGFFDRAIFTDPNFFENFSYQILYGDTSSLLGSPKGVVISEALSRKLFGEENPVGRQLNIKYGSWIVNAKAEESDAFITGVFKPETHAHLQFDLVTSFATPNTLDSVKWSGPVVSTYLKLQQDAKEEILEAKLADFYDRHHESLENMYQPTLQPVGDIHLTSSSIQSDNLNYKKFDISYLELFKLLSLIILAISTINYVQLSIGVRHRRVRQQIIGAVMGGVKNERWVQSFIETSILLAGAFLLAVITLQTLKPWIEFTWDFGWSLHDFLRPNILGVLGGLLIVLSVVPHVGAKIGEKQFLDQLKSQQSGGTSWVSKALIGFQMVLGIGLLVGSIVVFRQTEFILNESGSVSKDFVLQLPMSEESKLNYQAMKVDLLNETSIRSVTAGSNQFGEIGGLDLKVKTDGEEKILILPTLMVDPDFLIFYDIEIIEGANFTTDGSGEFIINKTMADQFGWEDPIGQQIGFAYGRPGKVVGVVDDFNYNSLHKKVEAFCFWNTNYYRVISIEVRAQNMPETLSTIDKIWTKHVSDAPFSFTFLEEDMKSLYEAELNTNTIIRYLTFIAILLAVMGIYSLTYLISKQRLKEASIKKVLGASRKQLIISYSISIYILLILSIVIALPVSYYILQPWLEGFAYRITLPITESVIGICGMVVVSSAALIYNFNRLVNVNPAEMLKE